MLQEIVRNWEGYNTTVHVRRSSTNHNWKMLKTWQEAKNSWAAQIELEWAPISKVLQFHSVQLQPYHSTHSNTHQTFFYPENILSLSSYPLSKYSPLCYFIGTDFTFWWQVNLTKENQCTTAPKAWKEHKTGKRCFFWKHIYFG